MSICTIRSPGLTRVPVSTVILVITPDALDLTSIDGDRLDHAVRLRVDDDVAAGDEGGLHGRRLRSSRTGCGGNEHQRRAEDSFH